MNWKLTKASRMVMSALLLSHDIVQRCNWPVSPGSMERWWWRGQCGGRGSAASLAWRTVARAGTSPPGPAGVGKTHLHADWFLVTKYTKSDFTDMCKINKYLLRSTQCQNTSFSQNVMKAPSCSFDIRAITFEKNMLQQISTFMHS